MFIYILQIVSLSVSYNYLIAESNIDQTIRQYSNIKSLNDPQFWVEGLIFLDPMILAEGVVFAGGSGHLQFPFRQKVLDGASMHFCLLQSESLLQLNASTVDVISDTSAPVCNAKTNDD